MQFSHIKTNQEKYELVIEESFLVIKIYNLSDELKLEDKFYTLIYETCFPKKSI